MLGSTHLVTGISTASWTAVPLLAAGVPVPLVLLSVPVGAYAALLPDIDHPGSRVVWCLPPVSNFASWVIRGGPICLWLPLMSEPLIDTRVFPWHVEHRHETHTKTAALIFGLVLGLPLALIPGVGWWWWAFAVQIAGGCLTHRYGDMRTVSGLPVKGERKTIGRTFHVGSDYEHWARAVIYTPCAAASVIGALLTAAQIGAL